LNFPPVNKKIVYPLKTGNREINFRLFPKNELFFSIEKGSIEKKKSYFYKAIEVL
jgi:hypothetical protein